MPWHHLVNWESRKKKYGKIKLPKLFDQDSMLADLVRSQLVPDSPLPDRLPCLATSKRSPNQTRIERKVEPRIVNVAGSKKEWFVYMFRKKNHLSRIIFERVCTSSDHNAKTKYAQIGKSKFQNKHYMVLCEINELVLLDKN